MTSASTATATIRPSRIRHFDGDNYGGIWAQAKRGVIVAVEWTWRKHRICPTKKEAQRVQKVWERWYRRLGWEISTSGGARYAINPDTGEEHGCRVTVYDAETRKRLT